MPVIQLEALDTLFFRDGKPFTMGEDNFAEGAFPPSPSVIYGALRTAYIAQHLDKNGKTIDNLIEDTEGLEIKQYAFVFDNALRFPMPLDFAMLKSNIERKKALMLSCEKSQNGSHQFEYVCIAPQNKHLEQVNDAVFSQSILGDYLDGNLNNITEYDIQRWSSFVTNEPKFGNSRNNETRSTSDDDGNVYRVNMRRMKDLKIVVQYELPNHLSANTLLRLGGEGKVAITSNYSDISIVSENLSLKQFKLYLTSPALFKNGAIPDLENWLKEKDLNYELKLHTALVGKPVNIGGWDIDKKEPKPMLNAVPAGSVYYFEITNEKTVLELQNDIQNYVSISDYRPKEGFGLFKIAHLSINN